MQGRLRPGRSRHQIIATAGDNCGAASVAPFFCEGCADMRDWQSLFLRDPANQIVVFGTPEHRLHSMNTFVDHMRFHGLWLAQKTTDLTRSILMIRMLRNDHSARFDITGYVVTQRPAMPPRATRVVITPLAADLAKADDLVMWHKMIEGCQ